ncbi:MAG: thymidine kinase [Acidobacteria bacterium]|nr:thymidine kinase [Acidobacteriota bacterium]
MNIARTQGGWIEVICGGMFSGKSEELIRRIRRAQIAKQRVQVFKPVIDTRYAEVEIVSHSNMRIESEPVTTAIEILDRVQADTDVVGVDEGQFFDNKLIDVCNRLANHGRRVIVAGLDLDYLGQPFEPIPQLLAIAENITKTSAICVRCGHPANFSQRIVESADRVLLGALGLYEPRCRSCFIPGVAQIEETTAVEKA